MARKRRGQASGSHEQQAQQAAVLSHKRTTEEINFSVLSRYVPGLNHIIDIAPFTVLYIFSAETRQWEKCGIEGSLFVCQTWRDGYHGYSVVILNRKSLNNFIVDITGTNQVELTEQYVILQGVEEDGSPQIYGVWVFSEDGTLPNTKDRVGEVIQRCAVAVEEETDLAQDEVEDTEAEQYAEQGSQQPIPGQPLDLNSLFSRPQTLSTSYAHQLEPQPSDGQQLDLLKLFGGQHQQPEPYPPQIAHHTQQHPTFMPRHPPVHPSGASLGAPQHHLLNLFKSGGIG